MQEHIITGGNLPELLSFLEEKQDNKEISNVEVQPEYVENSKTLGVELTTIVLTGLVDFIGSLIIEFYKTKLSKTRQNEIVITKKNKSGDEIQIILKNLNLQEVQNKLMDFLDE